MGNHCYNFYSAVDCQRRRFGWIESHMISCTLALLLLFIRFCFPVTKNKTQKNVLVLECDAQNAGLLIVGGIFLVEYYLCWFEIFNIYLLLYLSTSSPEKPFKNSWALQNVFVFFCGSVVKFFSPKFDGLHGY